MKKIIKTKDEWAKELPKDVFHITREAGTEPAFSGEYWNTKDKGIYRCACCNRTLFHSKNKYDSGTGWPSFTIPIKNEFVEKQEDLSGNLVRTEVVCSRCNAHLGHVFQDGPKPEETRYCINSKSLKLGKS